MAEAQPTPAAESTAHDEWVDVAPSGRARRRALLLIGAVYLVTSFVAGPVKPGQPSAVAHRQLGPIYLGRPIVTWGDPPHYLAIVNSMIDDGDLDLRNNYDQAEAGGWDVGTRFRGTVLDRHIETDLRGRQLSYHPIFLPALLAAVAWPFHGGEWVESVCIWFTLAVTLWGLAWCARAEGMTPRWLVVLALATPLWVYARDVWTEPYQAMAWMAFLVVESPLALAAIVIGSVLLKVTFVVVPLALAAVVSLQGERRRGAVLAAASVAALAIAVVSAQFIFRDADHFNLLHLAKHINSRTMVFGPRWDAPFGLLFDPENGLLFFCPFVVLGLPALLKDPRLSIPALALFTLHAVYGGWRAGSGVSARFLIPMLPVLVLAVARTRPRGAVTALLVGYSAAVAIVAGVLPVAAFDKTPWGMVQFLTDRLALLFG